MHRSAIARPHLLGATFLAFLLVSCGGAATSIDAGGQDSDGSGASPTAQQSAEPANGGGGDTGGLDDFCLVSAEDVAAAVETNVADAVSSEIPGTGGVCLYNDSAGVPLVSINVVSTGGAPLFDLVRGAPESDPVAGIGDEAYYMVVEGRASLAFMKGGMFVTVTPFSQDLLDGDPDRVRAATEEISRMAADGM